MSDADPGPDPNEPQGEHDERVRVRCMGLSCRQDYVTSKRAFFAQGCVCPRCGASKAQLRDE